MKKYATVPFRCKLKRLIKKISNSGIRIKDTAEVSFCRDKDFVPDTKFSTGFEFFISIKTILIATGAAIAALGVAILSARLAFAIAVGRASKRK